jgi:hypothetical protein
MRFYQISLRTILEAVFVVAVVLGFIYWRNMPSAAAARYQVEVLPHGGLVFIDMAIGEMWLCPMNSSKFNWTPIDRPPLKK